LFGRELPASPPEQTEYESIQGTSAWDEGTKGELPKIVMEGGKKYGWVELGKELMSYEGWRVRTGVR
jgi:hypothetical protein